MFAEALAAAGLGHDGITTYSTPRRLALIARELAAGDRSGQRRTEGAAHLGAAAGAGRLPAQDRADPGSARGSRRHLVRQDRPAGQGDQRGAGRSGCGDRPRFPLAQVDALGRGLCVDGRRCAGCGRLHSIVALLGEEIVPVAIDGVECGATTLGHRFHHPGADHHRRSARLCREAARLPCDRRPGGARGDDPRRRRARRRQKAGFTLVEDEGLVVENAGLTEPAAAAARLVRPGLPRCAGGSDPAYRPHQPEIFRDARRGGQACAAISSASPISTPTTAARRSSRAMSGCSPRGSAMRASSGSRTSRCRSRITAKKLDSASCSTKAGHRFARQGRAGCRSSRAWLVEEGIVKGADPETGTSAPRGWPRPTSSPGWSGNFPSCRA